MSVFFNISQNVQDAVIHLEVNVLFCLSLF